MANYNEILKHWHDTHAEEMEELQFWLDDFDTEDADTPEELAFQLTAYENGWFIDFDKWINDQLNIKLDQLDDSELVALNNDNANYGSDYVYDDLSEMLQGMDPERVVWTVHCGDFHGGVYGYYQFDGYDNLKEGCAIDLINKDNCLEALRDQMPELSEEAKNVLIQMTIELVKAGY